MQPLYLQLIEHIFIQSNVGNMKKKRMASVIMNKKWRLEQVLEAVPSYLSSLEAVTVQLLKIVGEREVTVGPPLQSDNCDCWARATLAASSSCVVPHSSSSGRWWRRTARVVDRQRFRSSSIAPYTTSGRRVCWEMDMSWYSWMIMCLGLEPMGWMLLHD